MHEISVQDWLCVQHPIRCVHVTVVDASCTVVTANDCKHLAVLKENSARPLLSDAFEDCLVTVGDETALDAVLTHENFKSGKPNCWQTAIKSVYDECLEDLKSQTVFVDVVRAHIRTYHKRRPPTKPVVPYVDTPDLATWSKTDWYNMDICR
ncbi:unknown [Singapore grouper iridovirus]|uniref:Uncharacterized protein n=1 Tax=Singapore grouper iridovirus TaxID=262968 RepID=Q5YFP1_9VIRU|nr:hypothetical protein ORF024L [Singapore grouper iridovirus]AAS18039.1 unknown [Singapore grouper iridovirus]WAU86733.1 hypothetical protein ORF024L [Singapore grouper iridovirus]